MSQQTHRPKETKRDRFNDLLTLFGKEIKDWATGKTKGPFNYDRKLHLYSHIQWKPIPPPVNPDCPLPEITCVIGQEMGLKLLPGDEHVGARLIVKKNEIANKNHGSWRS